MRTTTTLAAVLIMLILPIGGRSPVQAHDDAPCGDPYWHDGVEMDVQDCAMWRGSVPVFAGFDGTASEQVVGELVSAEGNWFTCQTRGATHRVPKTDYINDWWAATIADNGAWGFVNQAYFLGGDNNEPDATLRHCSDPTFEQQNVEVEWSDCIWGDASNDQVVETFEAKDGSVYELSCERVDHIRQGHGFTEDTIPCITRVLASYNDHGPSRSTPHHYVYRIVNEPVPDEPGYVLTAFVVVNPANGSLRTAFVEVATVGLMPPYQGDTWSACVPSPGTA